MLSNKTKLRTVGVLIASLSPLMIASMASGDSSNNYGPFPVTVKGYDGSATNSVSYSGQIARHVLHDSLKKLASTGDGGAGERHDVTERIHREATAAARDARGAAGTSRCE